MEQRESVGGGKRPQRMRDGCWPMCSDPAVPIRSTSTEEPQTAD